MPTVSTQPSLRATDQPLYCHLATGHVTKPRINSPRRPWRRLTVRVTSTAPSRRAQRGQSAQRMRHVPVRLYPVQPRLAQARARRRAPDTTTPSPCIAVHRHALATHRFSSSFTEPDTFSRETASHRRSNPTPWTQRTTPSPDAALAIQSRPMDTTVDRAHPSE
jgi:hypothetical protein